MPKLLIAFALATLLLASSGIWKAYAATIASAGTLAPLTKSYGPAERLPTATDTPAEPIAVGITATAIGLITAMATDAHIMATPTGHMVITATAGDQASPSVSDEAGVGATKDYATKLGRWMQGFFRSSKRGERMMVREPSPRPRK